MIPTEEQLDAAVWAFSEMGQRAPTDLRACLKSAINAATPSAPVNQDGKDAGRYRWLRMQDWFSSPLYVLHDPQVALTEKMGLGAGCPSRERLDEAIDAAIERAKEV